jgi:hypothetical protein
VVARGGVGPGPRRRLRGVGPRLGRGLVAARLLRRRLLGRGQQPVPLATSTTASTASAGTSTAGTSASATSTSAAALAARRGGIRERGVCKATALSPRRGLILRPAPLLIGRARARGGIWEGRVLEGLAALLSLLLLSLLVLGRLGLAPLGCECV